MKVLIITKTAIRSEYPMGNTLINFFQGTDFTEVSSLYFEKGKPNSNMLKRYNRVSELNDGKLKEFDFSSTDDCKDMTATKLSWFRNTIKKIRLLHFLREVYMFFLVSFKKKEIRKIAQKYEVIFAPVIQQRYHTRVVRLVLCYNPKVKLVSFIADDTMTQTRNVYLFGFFVKNRIRKMYENLKKSSAVFGASKKLSDIYSKRFNIEICPLYKSVSYITDTQAKKVASKFKIIYGGNLLYGRMQKLIDFVLEIRNSNISTKIEISVFSNTKLGVQERKIFNDIGFVSFKDAIPYEELMREMMTSDLLLFLESDLKKDIRVTRYSFSTKIVDYLQCKVNILAFGPNGIESMDYIRSISSEFVINDKRCLINKLKWFMDNPDYRIKIDEKIHYTMSVNHSKSRNNDILLKSVI